MGRKQRTKLLQFVDDLVAQATRAMTTALPGVTEDAARVVATDIAHRICSQYGRSYMYVPTDLDFELSARDKEIWRKYGEDGTGERAARRYTRDRVDELAQEYDLTPQQIYNIVRLMHRLEVKDRQGSLPGLEQP